MGFDAKAHDRHFRRNELDQHWLRKVGEKNWRVITADQEMESLHHESIVAGNVGVFILSDIKKGETFETWLRMLKSCEIRFRHACIFGKRPFVARISREGNLWRLRHLKSHARIEDITIETLLHAETFGIVHGKTAK